MCLIVDASVASRVLVAEEDPDFSPVREALFAGKLQMVYGGELRKEYLRIGTVARVVRILDQAGRAKLFSDAEIDKEASRLEGLDVCVSNDYHILALAMVTGARLLCSDDEDLHTDFKNGKILPKSKGKIYQYASHRNLLKRRCKICGKLG